MSIQTSDFYIRFIFINFAYNNLIYMAVNVFFLRVSGQGQQLESQYDELWNHYSRIDNLNRDAIRVVEYKESGVKLSEEERLGITELKGIVASEGVDTIYTSELSRIARTEKVLWSFIEYLQENKIQLKCKNPEFTLLDENRVDIPFSSRLIVSTFGTLATQEAIEKKSRFARGKERKAKEGKYNGGAIPYGYKIDKENGNLIVVDEGGEADVVREIFNMYENGMSQPKIAKELFERGVKSRAVKTTKTFTISLVHQILTNRLLTGEPCKNRGSSYERTYPMIITPEQFDRCRKIADENNTKAPKAPRVYYAHSLIECTTCGRKYVGTGSKGYYHCWDAYYPYRAFNGSGDTPRCTNRLCISTNIMDSLLWELAKDLEANFIIHSSKEQLEECEKAKSILETKLVNIDSRRQIVEDKMDTLLDALAEGMKKDRFRTRKAALMVERKEIDADEANYKEQILKYEELISELRRQMGNNIDFDTVEGIEAFLDDADDVWKRVVSITDDAERSKIIHKHIEKITIEATTINYKFAKYPEGKDVSAKLIKVFPYTMSKPMSFYFVPNDGKGGIMLKVNDNAGEVVNMPDGNDVQIPEYEEFSMEYLPRIVDTGKQKRREVERTRRANIKSLGTESLRKEGYITMNEMREDSGLSYATLYAAIRDGKMDGKNMFKTWYVKKKDYKKYMKKYAPKPRPYRQKTSVVPVEALNESVDID